MTPVNVARMPWTVVRCHPVTCEVTGVVGGMFRSACLALAAADGKPGELLVIWHKGQLVESLYTRTA